MSSESKYFIEFVSDGRIPISKEESILEASMAAGIPHFHVCGGKAKCSTCRVLVIDGAHWLTPPSEKESRLKHRMDFPPNVRLACQTYVRGGPIKLRRIIQDESDIRLYVGSEAGLATRQMGEEMELVLLFLDIRNFTHFVENHLAFDVIHIIRKLFSLFQNIIAMRGGRIVETTGDGLYVVFDCKTDKVNSVRSAIEAARSMLSDLEKLNKTYFLKHFDERIRIGIGAHFGKVVGGDITIGTEEHFVVMGYPVHIASRLQNATKELNNDFIVSAEMFELLQSSAEDPFKIIQVKGISAPIKVYLLGKSYA
jgi:adenylate cyclase